MDVGSYIHIFYNQNNVKLSYIDLLTYDDYGQALTGSAFNDT